MSWIFGPVYQIGHVSSNVDDDVSYWQRAGIGPFKIIRKLELEHYEFNGKESMPDLTVAIGFSGEIELEFIQQNDQAPSSYRHFFGRHGAGPQHLGIRVADYDAAIEKARALGYALNSRGKLVGGPRFSYFGTPSMPGRLLELVESTASGDRALAARKRAAGEWRGEYAVPSSSTNAATGRQNDE